MGSCRRRPRLGRPYFLGIELTWERKAEIIGLCDAAVDEGDAQDALSKNKHRIRSRSLRPHEQGSTERERALPTFVFRSYATNQKADASASNTERVKGSKAKPTQDAEMTGTRTNAH